MLISENQNLGSKNEEVKVEAILETNRIWDGRTHQACDIIEKRIYVGDAQSNECVFVSYFSSYDLWNFISVAEDVWLGDAFASGYANSKRAINTTLISGLYLWADSDSKRTFKLIKENCPEYHTIICSEKMLSGSVDLIGQGYKPYPSGHIDADTFVIKVSLDQGLESSGGLLIPPGEALWFRICFEKMGWLNNYALREKTGDNECPWELFSVPLPIIFKPTNKKWNMS